MKPDNGILQVSSTMPHQHQAEADSALRKIATVLADRDATTEQVMQALREWSRIVTAQRDSLAAASQPAGQRPSPVDTIVDKVTLSAAAQSLKAS